MKQLTKIALVPLAFISGWSVVQANETVNIQVADFSGKPPFKRTTLAVSVEDVAKLEAISQNGEPTEYVEVRTVEMRGKPPYRRQVEKLPVYDIAQLEEVQQQVRTGRPPFKR